MYGAKVKIVFHNSEYEGNRLLRDVITYLSDYMVKHYKSFAVRI
jgi:hypothetical protein